MIAPATNLLIEGARHVKNGAFSKNGLINHIVANAHSFAGLLLLTWVFALTLLSLHVASTPIDWNVDLVVADSRPDAIASHVDPTGVAWGYGLRDGYQVLKVGEESARQFVGTITSASEITFTNASGVARRAAPDIGIPYDLALAAVAVLFAWMGGFVFRWAPDPQVGRAFFAFAGAIATGLAAVPFGLVSSLSAAMFMGVLFFAVPASILVLALYFPERCPHASSLLRFILGAFVLLTAVDLFVYTPDQVMHESLGRVLDACELFSMCAGVFLLAIRAVRTRKHETKVPIGIGILVGLGPYLTLTALPQFVTGSPIAPSQATGVLTAFVPAAVGYAIVRHRLYGLDLLFRRAATQFGLVAVAPLIFVPFFLTTHAFGLTWVLAAIVSATVVTVITTTVWSRVQGVLDASLKRRLDVARVRPGLNDAADPKIVLEALMDYAYDLLPVSWQAFFVASRVVSGHSAHHHRWVLRSTRGSPPPGLAGVYLSHDFKSPAEGSFDVLLKYKDEPIAVWVVGPLVDGVPPARPQRRLPAELAGTAAEPLGLALKREEVLAESTPHQNGKVSFGPASSRLSPREREVAGLIAQGLSNQQIGCALGVKPGTAAKHIEHIMAKLKFQSRSQIAAWAAERGLGSFDGHESTPERRPS